MGMFDRIHARCPNCGDEIELQSKSGKCILANFSSEYVPVEVAVGVQGDTVFCGKCKNSYTIVLDQSYVRIILLGDCVLHYEEEGYDGR